MRTLFVIVALWLTLSSIAGPARLAAQSTQTAPVDAKAQITPILSAVPKGGATPTGWLPSAMADARLATGAAIRALQAETPAAMQQAAVEVLQAIDPALVPTAASRGIGVRPAVRAIGDQMQVVAPAGATGDIRATAPHAEAAVKNLLVWCDEVVQKATALRATQTTTAGLPLARTLVRQTAQLTRGLDRNGDGRVSLTSGEGGLAALQLALGTLIETREAQARPVPAPPATPTAAPRSSPSPPVPPPLVLRKGAAR